MRTKILFAITIVGLLAALAALVAPPRFAAAEPAKDLQVLPKGTEKKAVKKIMKTWAKALGVECDHCHDMDDLTLDSKNKTAARKMFKMVETINAKYFAKSKEKVSCVTCHRGKEEPPK
jgi:hypothetical protein